MIELALNLAWLALLLPAYLLWQRRRSDLRSGRAVLVLACLLLLLFPVISLSDDLSLMRAEMEDATAPERGPGGHGEKHNLARFAAVEMLCPVPVLLAQPTQYISRVEMLTPTRPTVLSAPAVNPRSPPVHAA